MARMCKTLIFVPEDGNPQLLFPPMRAGPGLMAVIPQQQQVHQGQSQSQGQPQSQMQQSSHGRPSSLPSTPITIGLKRLSDEDTSEQNGTEAKRCVLNTVH